MNHKPSHKQSLSLLPSSSVTSQCIECWLLPPWGSYCFCQMQCHIDWFATEKQANRQAQAWQLSLYVYLYKYNREETVSQSCSYGQFPIFSTQHPINPVPFCSGRSSTLHHNKVSCVLCVLCVRVCVCVCACVHVCVCVCVCECACVCPRVCEFPVRTLTEAMNHSACDMQQCPRDWLSWTMTSASFPPSLPPSLLLSLSLSTLLFFLPSFEHPLVIV